MGCRAEFHALADRGKRGRCIHYLGRPSLLDFAAAPSTTCDGDRWIANDTRAVLGPNLHGGVPETTRGRSHSTVQRLRASIAGYVGAAPGAIQSITTLASTTAMTSHLFQPASALLDHQVGGRGASPPPRAHRRFRMSCPFSER